MVKGARLHEIYICTFRKVSDATEIKTLLPLRNIQYSDVYSKQIQLNTHFTHRKG